LTLNQKNQKARKAMTFILKISTMLVVIYGCISAPGTAWSLGDIGVGLMAWINVVAILIMQKPAFLCLADYEAQKKAGLDPTFDPVKLNITETEAWKKS
jgi:AGCS family alanine or glycine:cation symporter